MGTSAWPLTKITGRCWLAAVQIAGIEYIALPSPITATGRRDGPLGLSIAVDANLEHPFDPMSNDYDTDREKYLLAQSIDHFLSTAALMAE